MAEVSDTLKTDLKTRLDAQKSAFLSDGPPSYETRVDQLNRCISLLVEHETELVNALSADFGHRSREQSSLTDIASSISALKHARTHLKGWMKPERRTVDPWILSLFGARARVEFQPKGVVGIVAPWNFPVNLSFVPLAGILAAGNRAMLKPSEFTPATSAALAELISKRFDATEIDVVTGGPDVGAAFSSLPFDHLLFTGATSIAYHVMRAAAENLVPVTLELGGKSPAIISETADMKLAATRVMTGKTLNAGQICLAPDYVLTPQGKVADFVAAAQASVSTMFPTIKDNDDYTSIVNQRHYERLQGYVEDARSKGAEIVELNPADEHFDQQPHHKMPPTLILNPTDDMTVMQEEIFGPVLPVKGYSSTSEAIAYINANARPLGLYYFGKDDTERDMVLSRTTAGGVTVNDVLFHNAQEDLPFGGIGPSGMGSYHGQDGFREFSHAKAIYTQAKFDVLSIMRPPYGKMFHKQVSARIKV